MEFEKNTLLFGADPTPRIVAIELGETGTVKVYRREADKQKVLVKKAQLTENRLLFIVSALKKLFQDEDFVTLLRAEKLDTLPAYLAERIQIEATV